ncbi:MAG: LysM peptidoglycan-binding domain-containing protein [Firmicutes bacterium]|nr:LysM peptidoglycan-binding domain-containing protein [Bacillota bacterium]
MTKRQRRRLRRRLRNLCLLVTCVFLILSLTTVLAQSSNNSTDYLTYTVQSGDTLWEIASEYRGRTEIRRYIDLIRSHNDLGTSHIRPGQVLELP